MTETADRRKKLLGKIRALRAKTVENGCTEAEAMAAASLAAALIEQYEISAAELGLDDPEFAETGQTLDDEIGRNLGILCQEIAAITNTRTWQDFPGRTATQQTFFGFAHDIEVARYLLDICTGAMRTAADQFRPKIVLFGKPRRDREMNSYLSGMSASMAENIRKIRWHRQNMSESMSLVRAQKEEAVGLELKSRGINLGPARTGFRETSSSAYVDGLRDGSRIEFNAGLNETTPRRNLEIEHYEADED